MKRYSRHKNRLYRSRKESIFFGVCGGIAEHFGLPVLGVRIVLVILTLSGAGLFVPIIYVILGLTLKIAPEEEFESYEQEEFWNAYETSRSDALRKVHRQFQTLDKRLQRMESIVTKPSFDLESEWRNL